MLVGVQLFQHLGILLNFVLRFNRSFALDNSLFGRGFGLFLELFVLLSDFGNFTLDLADVLGQLLNHVALVRLLFGLGIGLNDFLRLIFLVDFGLGGIIIFIEWLLVLGKIFRGSVLLLSELVSLLSSL